MEEAIQKICDDILRQYKRDDNVLGVLLFGSVARNKFDKYSDVDIYVLLDKKGKYSRSNFVSNGIRVDVIMDTLAEARDFLKEDKNMLKRVTSHMIAHGRILFQKGNEIEKLQKIALNNLKLRTKFTRSEILMHKYSIDDFAGEISRDIEKNDPIAFALDSNLLVNNIIELFFKLHGEYLRQPNEMSVLLKKIDSNFAKSIETFYKANTLVAKKQAMSKLVTYIYKKSNGPLPQKWFLKA